MMLFINHFELSVNHRADGKALCWAASRRTGQRPKRMGVLCCFWER